MDDPGRREPDGDEDGDQLGQSDGGRRLEDVQVLENVRNSHKAEGTEKPEPYIGEKREIKVSSRLNPFRSISSSSTYPD